MYYVCMILLLLRNSQDYIVTLLFPVDVLCLCSSQNA